MIAITLPDGSKREFEAPVTVADVAASIGAGLAKAALAGRVDGKLVDTSFLIEKDASLAIITAKDAEALELIRHSTAHLMAQAVKQLYPEAQVTIGPAIDNGFYYDFSYKRPFTPEDLEAIEARMHEIVKQDLKVERSEMKREDAVEFFRGMGEAYKAELVEAIPEGEVISLYRQGDFIDLCRGPHVPSTGKLKVFKLMKVAGAYWRGDSNNEMLQRIYGTAFASKEDLAAYLHMLEEAEKRDHRRLGRELDLFHLQDEAPGHLAGRRAVHAQDLPRQRLRRSEGAAAPRPLALGALRPLGEVPRKHVHDRIGEPLLRPEAHELPGPHPDLQLAASQLPRPAPSHR